MASDEEPDAGSGREAGRSQGIELGELDEELESHDYPATSGELVDEYGDHEIQLPGGSQQVSEVLGVLEDDDQGFTNAEEVRYTIHNLVGAEAVGRDHYSDRGGSAPEEGLDDEDESF